MAVERIGGPLKNIGGGAAKELTEETAKEILEDVATRGVKTVADRIFTVLKKTGKEGIEEGAEELITSFGNDALGEALDILDGDKDYGVRAQWEQMKEQNPNASLADFAKSKAKEYMDSFLGGALSGMEISGATNTYNEARNAKITRNVNKAKELGLTVFDAGDMYDLSKENTTAVDNAVKAFSNEEGKELVSREFFDSLSSEDALALSESDDISVAQKAALVSVATAKAAQEGLNQRFDEALNAGIETQKKRISSVTENGNVVTGTYNGKLVYVKGGVSKDGAVTLPSGENGPVVLVDVITGEQTTARSEDVTYAETTNAEEYTASVEKMLRDNDAHNREVWRNTMSARAKLRDVQQYAGKKILINGENGAIEVYVQQISPNGEVIVKGKKGDLGGQSIVTMDAAKFYDSIYRDGEGKPVITNAPAEETVEETEEVVEETPEAVVTGEEDYREQVVPIVINGKVVSVEVTGQDNTADRITYEYTDENGNVKSGSSTIGAFKTAAEQATTQQPEVETEAEVEPTINETVEEAPIDEAPVEEVTSEEIDWDALFEQDPYLYLKELQKQYGDGAVDVIDMEINATRGELESLEKNVGKTKNERMENLKRVSKLRTELGILEELKRSAAKSKATTTPETPTDTTPEVVAEPATETTTEEATEEETPVEEAPVSETPVEEVQPEPEPVAEPVAEEVTPEPVAVAPMPVDNPIAEAKKREEQLLTLLGKAGVSNELKTDAAKRAGKEVADMFATREEYEQYEAEVMKVSRMLSMTAMP